MKKIIFLITLCFITICTAQENGEDKWGSWYMYFGTNKISDKLSIHTEAQFRYYETTSNFNQMLLRTGLNYHIEPNAIATIGYGYITTDSSFEELINEEKSKENRQRFIEYLDEKDTQHRARYRLQVTLPLTDIFFLNFYDEIFINLQNEAFGQNRLYGALGINVTENLSIQAGYLKNHFTDANFDRLQFSISYNPDLRKK